MADRDSDSQEQDVSLKDVMKAVRAQGELNAKLNHDISNLRQEVHGASVSVASKVKKLKTESQYKWKYEGNKVKFLLNSELLEELNNGNSKITELRTIFQRESQIKVITKLPNSEQSYKGKVKTHKYINRQNQSTTGKLWKP